MEPGLTDRPPHSTIINYFLILVIAAEVAIVIVDDVILLYSLTITLKVPLSS